MLLRLWGAILEAVSWKAVVVYATGRDITHG